VAHKEYGQTGVASEVEFGKGGPKLKDESGKLTAYQNDGATLQEVEGAAPTGPNAFATREYVDTRSGAPVTGQIPGSSPPAVVDGAFYICTETGGAYTEKNLYYGKGGSWIEKVPVEGMTIHVTDALTGYNQEYLADHVYIWDADASTWNDIGPYNTKTVKTERVTLAFGDTGVNNIGSALPANARVRSVKANVTQTFDGTTPVLKVGDASDDDRHMTEAENDLETVGLYQTEVAHLYGSQTQVTATLTIGGTPTQGAVALEIEYSLVG